MDTSRKESNEASMNTPTPAQALGECLRLLDAADTGGSAGEAIVSCMTLVRLHGQHFAGLEVANDSARKTLAKALDADLAPDEPLRTLAVRASNALYWRTQAKQEAEARAQAAEARCAELEGGCQMLREEVEGLRAAFLAARG